MKSLSGAPVIGLWIALITLFACSNTTTSPSYTSQESPEVGQPAAADTDRRTIHDLDEGDCFNTSTNSGVITVVDYVACADSHRFEVVAVNTYPDVTRPNDSALVGWAREACRAALADRFGVIPGNSTRLAFALPDELDWVELGDRNVMCFYDAGPSLTVGQLALDPPPVETTPPPPTSTTTPSPLPAATDLNLSELRQCLHTAEATIGSPDDLDCKTNLIVEATAQQCPRGILETWVWSYDSFDCEASVYLLWWEFFASRQVDVEVDGVYLPDETAAVRQFQAANALEVDGFIGPLTWSAISEFNCGGVPATSEVDFCNLAEGNTWVPGDQLPTSVSPLALQGQ
ncbi:MAG: septum formation family protein [Ilumatobacteraceae bacterium]|nr:septum formation family protein [Ilumatobacteraceae bacterium]